MKKPRNIILFGFMGTGKTAVARRLGERLARPVIEMDDLIEKREGMPISRIFAERGEEYFRKRERELVRKLALARGNIIATGGGVVLDPANIRDLAREGRAVCLTARLEVILARVAGESHRPLLECADRREAIEKLLKSRRSCYELVPQQIDTSSLNPEEVADRILLLVRDGVV